MLVSWFWLGRMTILWLFLALNAPFCIFGTCEKVFPALARRAMMINLLQKYSYRTFHPPKIGSTDSSRSGGTCQFSSPTHACMCNWHKKWFSWKCIPPSWVDHGISLMNMRHEQKRSFRAAEWWTMHLIGCRALKSHFYESLHSIPTQKYIFYIVDMWKKKKWIVYQVKR